MNIAIECRKCGHAYDVTRAQLAAGTWRDCPVCKPRDGDGRTETGGEAFPPADYGKRIPQR